MFTFLALGKKIFLPWQRVIFEVVDDDKPGIWSKDERRGGGFVQKENGFDGHHPTKTMTAYFSLLKKL